MLNNAKVEGAKAREKEYLIPDGDGLYLKVSPLKRKKWVVRYWQDSVEKKKVIGEYPVMSLLEARRERDQIKLNVRTGKEETAPAVTFQDVYRRWYDFVMAKKSEGYLKTIRLRYKYLYPIYEVPLNKLTRKDCYACIETIARDGRVETARRTAGIIKSVLDYAVGAGEVEYNIGAKLTNNLPTYQQKNFASVSDREDVRKLLRGIDTISIYVIRNALKFVALTFVRSNELNTAQWREIDWKRAQWVIPAGHTKRRREHLVPLSQQALKILDDLKRNLPQNGASGVQDGLIFPAPRGRATGGKMGRTVLLTALYKMTEELPEAETPPKMTVHGFRAMASTILNESGWAPDVIERQLAHVPEDKTRAAYNRAEYIDQRREMMQWYADYLDALRDGKELPRR